MGEPTTVTVEVADGVAQLRLDRPDAANAMNRAMWFELRDAVRELDADPSVRVVVISGNGRNFCAGIDLEMLGGLREAAGGDSRGHGAEELRRTIMDLQDCLTGVERCRKPVIAAVHGVCIGAGLDLAVACDLRYASADARFVLKEVDMGLAADVGVLQRLPRIVGEGVTRELAYFARPVSGTEAEHLRLVNEVLPDADALRERSACWPRSWPPSHRWPCAAPSTPSPTPATTRWPTGWSRSPPGTAGCCSPPTSRRPWPHSPRSDPAATGTDRDRRRMPSPRCTPGGHHVRWRARAMDITIVGGGAAALMTAVLAARDGHRVTVLERDPLPQAPTPADAAATAFRGSAPQIVQPHVLLSRYRLLLREHLPDVYRDLLAAGAVESDLTAQMPPAMTERAAGPDDDRFTMILTRRSTVDWVLGRIARAEPGLALRTGVSVRGLLAEPGTPPRVVGVHTDDGDVRSEVVVDAAGRRSRTDAWLAAIGARPRPVVSAECGVAYYSRHYRLRTRTGLPSRADNRTILPLDEFTVGVWGADADTMVVGICPLVEDPRFRAVRDAAVFTEVLRTVAQFRGWLDVLEPISDVFPMAGLHNTLHRLVDGGGPLALGLHAVGDSVCTTNPTLARGLGVSLRGALDLLDVLATYPSDPHARALAADRAVTEHVEPYFADQARIDALRLAQVRANLSGEPVRSSVDPPGAEPGSDRVGYGELSAASPFDAALFRALTTVKGMLARPDDVYTDPAVVRRVRAVLDERGGPPLPQPDRAELLAALSGSRVPRP